MLRLDDRAGQQVLELRARERRALAGLHELELDDGVRVPVHQDLEALADIGRVVHGAATFTPRPRRPVKPPRRACRSARPCAISTAVDAAAHYRQLAAARPRRVPRHGRARRARPLPHGRDRSPPTAATTTLTLDDETVDDSRRDACRTARARPGRRSSSRCIPLAKKPGASFPDRITIGRTANNDVVIADHSVSRLHAYVRRDGDGLGRRRRRLEERQLAARRRARAAQGAAAAVARGAAVRRCRSDVLPRGGSVRRARRHVSVDEWDQRAALPRRRVRRRDRRRRHLQGVRPRAPNWGDERKRGLRRRRRRRPR